MAQVIWNGKVLAESDDIALVEGNAYFPKDSVNAEYLRASAEKRTYCHWKGYADYYDIVVDDAVNEGAAWYYDAPYEASAVIKDRIAFWRDVEITGAPEGHGLVENKPSPRGKLTGWEALCWLLSTTDKTTLTAAEIEAQTDITQAKLAEVWQVYDVQRYAGNYNWQLMGEGAEARLEKAA